METNNLGENSPINGNNGTQGADQGLSPEQQSQREVMGRMFFSVLNRLLDTAKENASSGA